MGTNYYIYIPNEDVSQDAEKLHIGKSSVGWVFSLRIHGDRGILNLYDWLPVLLNSQNVIADEYGVNYTAAGMLRTITDRGRDEPSGAWSADERIWPHSNSRRRHLGLLRLRVLLRLTSQRCRVIVSYRATRRL
jgi:hypothetical protein